MRIAVAGFSEPTKTESRQSEERAVNPSCESLTGSKAIFFDLVYKSRKNSDSTSVLNEYHYSLSINNVVSARFLEA